MRDEPKKQLFYYELGENYFWLSGHYDASEWLLDRFLVKSKNKPSSSELKVLDAGCGPGNFISRMKHHYKVFGIDFSVDALQFCLEKHATPTFVSNLEELSVQNNSLDTIVSLEVLEHLDHDLKAMEEFFQALKPGGVMLISVPAFKFLWGAHDEWFGHRRRYTKEELCQKLKKAGFQISYCSYFKCLFFLPMFLMRKIKQILGMYDTVKTDYISIPDWLNQLLRWEILLEVKTGISRWLPFGTHLLCVALKPEKVSKK